MGPRVHELAILVRHSRAALRPTALVLRLGRRGLDTGVGPRCATCCHGVTCVCESARSGHLSCGGAANDPPFAAGGENQVSFRSRRAHHSAPGT